jgi:hypothetical protein
MLGGLPLPVSGHVFAHCFRVALICRVHAYLLRQQQRKQAVNPSYPLRQALDR